MTKVSTTPAIINAPLFKTATGVAFSATDFAVLTDEYKDRFNQDVKTAMSYVLAGTDRHDVNPGPCDTFSTIVLVEGKPMWHHDNKPERDPRR